MLQVGTVCAGPGGLAGRSVSTLLPFQLHCPDMAADSGADQVHCWLGCTCTDLHCQGCEAEAGKCPELCKCSNGVVDCRELGLTAVPQDIPSDSVEL